MRICGGIKLKLSNLSEWDSNGEMNNLNKDTWARMNLRFCCCFWFILIAKFSVSLPSFLYFCKSSLQPVELLLHCNIFEPYSIFFFCLLFQFSTLEMVFLFVKVLIGTISTINLVSHLGILSANSWYCSLCKWCRCHARTMCIKGTKARKYFKRLISQSLQYHFIVYVLKYHMNITIRS